MYFVYFSLHDLCRLVSNGTMISTIVHFFSVLCEAHIDIINNQTINECHLNASDLHLNRKVDTIFARNFQNYVKNKPNI